MDVPRKRPVVLLSGVTGGLAWAGDGRLLVGYGADLVWAATGGVVAPLGLVSGNAGILSADPDTGRHRTVAAGLTMANGLARASDGSIYATDFESGYVERVRRGHVDRRWALVPSANGIVYDGGHFLYAAQSAGTGTVARIDTRDGSVTPCAAAAPGPDAGAGLDGLARDTQQRLYAAGHVHGEIWRIGRGGSICTLAAGLGAPPLSGVADLSFGNGSGGFPATSLFAVTWAGQPYEPPHVLQAG